MNSDTFSFNPLTLNVGYAHSESQSHLKQSTYKPSTLVGRALETKVERMDLVGTDVTFKQGVGEIQELSMSSVTDKKSFIKNAMQVGLSVGLISLAAGNPLAITPSFGMDDTDHQEYLIQRGRSTFAIEDDTDLQIQSTTQTHEKEWSKNDSTSLSIAPITEAFNLYEGIQKARSLYAEIETKYQERLEQALPKNVITHAIETEEEFIKKNPSVQTTIYDRTKEQYKKTTKAAEAILKNIQKDYIITERWINDPKTVERMACRMNQAYQKARDQGLSPQESWLKVGMIAQRFVEGQVGISPRKEQANALIIKAGEVAAKYTVAAMTSTFLNEYGAYLSGKMVDLIHQMSNRLSGYVSILTSFQKEGFISKDSTERHHYRLKKDFVRSLKNFSSKIHQDHGTQVLANPIPKEQGPKVLSQPIAKIGASLKGFDGIPEELIGYAKILSYPKAQNHHSSWILGFPAYQDPKEGMILMRNEDPVKFYEVGTYRDQIKRSVGDKIEIHHAPQKHPAKQVIKGYDEKNAPSIALPEKEHRQIPNLKGTYEGNARSLLAQDVKNLREYTKTPNISIMELIKRSKEQYPESFIKKEPNK